MWNNAFNEDDPANAAIADMYGIVMGTSSPGAHASRPRRGMGPHARRRGRRTTQLRHATYSTDSGEGGLTRNKNYESIITMGLRGENDSAMVQGFADPEAIDLLNNIIPAQRKIIGETINPDVTKVPQMWSLYKEVQNYYETGGLHASTTSPFSGPKTANGNIRRLPTARGTQTFAVARVSTITSTTT